MGNSRIKFTEDAANSNNPYSIEDIVERGEYALDNSRSTNSKNPVHSKLVKDTHQHFQVPLSKSRTKAKIKAERKNQSINENDAFNLISTENYGKNSTA